MSDEHTADETITIGNREVLRFHPLHKRIRDKIPRCIACGQIDEDGYHEAKFCPGAGGALPFPTSSIKINLRADSGFRAELRARITLEQWGAINRIIAQ